MRLVFVGSGRFASELYGWMKKSDLLKSYEELCYISPTESQLPLQYMGPISLENLQSDDKLILAIGDIKYRRDAIDKLNTLKSNFISYIHPTALINENVELGSGIVVFPFCIISNDAIIGDFAFLNGYSSIGHDCVVGENLVMSPYAAITGNCKIGNDVYMATHSTVIPGRTIGNKCKISPTSVAMKDVQDGYTVIGNMGQTVKI